jgi:hypothetical protein
MPHACYVLGGLAGAAAQAVSVSLQAVLVRVGGYGLCAGAVSKTLCRLLRPYGSQ